MSQGDLAGKLAARHCEGSDGGFKDRKPKRYAMDYEAAAIPRALKVSVAWLFGETR